MVRRALLITVALCAVCVMASGAWAGDSFTEHRSITWDTVGTTYTSSQWSVDGFQRFWVFLTTKVADTATADSFRVQIQTRPDNSAPDSLNVWRNCYTRTAMLAADTAMHVSWTFLASDSLPANVMRLRVTTGVGTGDNTGDSTQAAVEFNIIGVK